MLSMDLKEECPYFIADNSILSDASDDQADSVARSILDSIVDSIVAGIDVVVAKINTWKELMLSKF